LSWAVNHLGSPFPTWKVRALLADRNLNTHSKTPYVDKIGVMPDLKSILSDIKGTIFNRLDAIFSILIGGIIYGGGGWRWTPGGGLEPVGPRVDRTPLTRLSADKRDVLIGLAMLELAGLISDPASRKAMERSSAIVMRSATEKIAAEIEQW
jgi:hypothetical protein